MLGFLKDVNTLNSGEVACSLAAMVAHPQALAKLERLVSDMPQCEEHMDRLLDEVACALHIAQWELMIACVARSVEEFNESLLTAHCELAQMLEMDREQYFRMVCDALPYT